MQSASSRAFSSPPAHSLISSLRIFCVRKGSKSKFWQLQKTRLCLFSQSPNLLPPWNFKAFLILLKNKISSKDSYKIFRAPIKMPHCRFLNPTLKSFPLFPVKVNSLRRFIVAMVAKINFKAVMFRKLSAAAAKNMVFFKVRPGSAKKTSSVFLVLNNASAHLSFPFVPSK